MNWVLACDFGTSNTTAAEIDEDGRIRAIGLADQGTSMPSAVCLTPSGTRVGQSAVNAQLVHPDGFEAAPKVLIGQDDVVLAGRFVKPEELVEAVYSVVRATALARHNGREPRELWLTHPVAWAPSQLEVLTRGAERAGFDRRIIRTVPEPIAAATHYATSRSIPPGTRVAVFDFGGGTLDIAVLERAPEADGGYRVLAYGGDPLLGGRSFDNRLLEWALATAREAGQGDLVDRIENPRDPKELRAKLALRRAVTAAKVELSTHADADIPMSVGEMEHVVTITRDEYEQLISADVERGGKLVKDVLDRVGGAKPDAIYLTGGSSRTPAIARMLHRVTGLIPATFDDPKLVVSEGALRVRPAVAVGAQQRPNAIIPAIGATPGVQGPLRPGAQGRQDLRPAPGPRMQVRPGQPGGGRQRAPLRPAQGGPGASGPGQPGLPPQGARLQGAGPAAPGGRAQAGSPVGQRPQAARSQISGPVGPGSNPPQGGPASRQIGRRAPMPMPRTSPSGTTGPAAPSPPSALRPLAGAPAAVPPARSRRGLWIALIAVGAVIALLIIAELIASSITRQNGAEGLAVPAPVILALGETAAAPRAVGDPAALPDPAALLDPGRAFAAAAGA